MSNIIDLVPRLKTKNRLKDDNTSLIADLIKAGDITEVIGIIKYNDTYFSWTPNDNPLNREDFKKILLDYADKIPSEKDYYK